MNPCRILIIEDEAVVAMDIEERLTRLGYEPAGHAVSGEEALSLAGAHRPDLVLMDIRLKGDMDGIATAVDMRRRFHLPVIFLTAYSEDQTLERAKTAEPFGYILKPFNDMELKSSIEVALHKHGMEERLFRMNRLYNTLSQVNQAIARTRKLEDLLPAICRAVVETSGVDLAWIGSVDNNSNKITPMAHAGKKGGDPLLNDLIPESCLEGERQLVKSIREGGPFVCPGHGNDACLCSVILEDRRVQPAFRSCASFPFQFGVGISGTLNLRSEREGFLGDLEIDLFTELARDLGLALENIQADERRRKAEQALAESEANLRSLFDAVSESLFVFDPRGRVLDCNRTFAERLNMRPAQVVGECIFDHLAPEVAARRRAWVEEVIRSGRPLAFEDERNGRWMYHHVAPVLSPDGGVNRLVSFAVDLTPQKQAEEALRASKEFLDKILDSISDPIFVKDEEHRFVLVNDALCRLAGGTREALLGKTDQDFFPPDRDFGLVGTFGVKSCNQT